MKNIAILASALFLLIAVEGWAQLPETLLKTTPASISARASAMCRSSSLPCCLYQLWRHFPNSVQ